SGPRSTTRAGRSSSAPTCIDRTYIRSISPSSTAECGAGRDHSGSSAVVARSSPRRLPTFVRLSHDPRHAARRHRRIDNDRPACHHLLRQPDVHTISTGREWCHVAADTAEFDLITIGRISADIYSLQDNLPLEEV